MVLWTIGTLSILVGSLAFDAHIEARITAYYRNRMKARHLAVSGIEIAEMLMAKSRKVDDNASEDEESTLARDDRWYWDAKELKEGDMVVVTEELGEGSVTVTIKPERARRNVNLLQKEAEWEGILEVGDVPDVYWPELVESFLDWTDGDDQARFDGAETEDYYSRLEPPYEAKNGPLDTVEELLRIKGFTKAIVEGGEIPSDKEGGDPVIISGIGDLLTTYGDRKVNVNAASRRVLMTLPDPNIDIIVDAIMEERQGFENEEGVREPDFFQDDQDLFSRIPELAQGEIKNYVTTAASTYYRITSVGVVNEVERQIWCIANYDGKILKPVRWVEGTAPSAVTAPDSVEEDDLDGTIEYLD